MNFPEAILQRANTIQLVIFDVDGVLTDGRLYFNDLGQETKAFHSRDGLGMRLLMDHGVQTAILTGRQSELVLHRARNLQMDMSLVYQGYRDKRPAFQELLASTGIKAEHMAYVGDDLIDLPVLTKVGLGIAVGDAHPLVKEQAHYTCQALGGMGAAREVCELILHAQGKLAGIIERYLA